MLSAGIQVVGLFILILLQLSSATPAPPTSPTPDPPTSSVVVISHPPQSNINLALNGHDILQFTIKGFPMTVKTRVAYIGTPAGSNCWNRYDHLYRITSKLLQRNTSVVCDMNYWPDPSNHHIQQLEVLLTNGEAAANVTQVVVYLRVEEADLSIQNYQFNVTMLKSHSLLHTQTPLSSDSTSTATPTATPTSSTQYGLINSQQSDTQTPGLFGAVIALAIGIATLIIVLVLVIVMMAHKLNMSRRQRLDITVTSQGA